MKKLFLVLALLLIFCFIISGCSTDNGTDNKITKYSEKTTAEYTGKIDKENITTTANAKTTTVQSSKTFAGASKKIKAIGKKKAESVLIKKIGKIDKKTGNKYSISFENTVVDNEKKYYNFSVSEIVTDKDGYAHVEYKCNYRVSVDGKSVAEFK